ncbi:MAG TPA: YeeE/YedE thiosulfate transporter family protein [Gemmatimonadaceae bacterium]|nr:YeeE/YedE thiosulfate transporter family protein [Gemmatimonadaceae bacterium]
MMAPFTDGSWVVAALVGVGFGVALERAGLGSAPKLAGQFTLTDFTVFKVMFTAIITAMLGAFWASRLGVLDLARVYVPETFLAPQLIGGAVFGVGFALAGLCPGTSCVSAATGRGDGLAVVLGFFAGVLATGALLPRLLGFYQSTPRGTLLLPSVFGVQYGIVVLGVVTIALTGFYVAERVEQRAVRHRT